MMILGGGWVVGGGWLGGEGMLLDIQSLKRKTI